MAREALEFARIARAIAQDAFLATARAVDEEAIEALHAHALATVKNGAIRQLVARQVVEVQREPRGALEAKAVVIVRQAILDQRIGAHLRVGPALRNRQRRPGQVDLEEAVLARFAAE